MLSPSLAGVWSQPSEVDPGQHKYMCIDETRGRIIVVITLHDRPETHFPIKHWYRQTSASTIEVRNWKHTEWRTHPFRFEGDCLIWTYSGSEHTWKHVPPTNAPEWLETVLAKAHRKLDEAEASSP